MTELKQLTRVTGFAALATMVLLFVPLVAASGQEPALDGSTAEIMTFLQSVSSPLASSICRQRMKSDPE